ncbi:MAG: 50S ribosome-binding GTPase [Planctomycetota bacterium]|nr:50S ribosome-binding GTPase [Planctomycetota bacterium]
MNQSIPTSGDGVTFVAQLTSRSPAAIAILALDGPRALEFAARCWSPNAGNSPLAINAIRYGFTQNEEGGCGESIVVCRTGEQRVELHCHGGRLAAETLVKILMSFGAVTQSPFQCESGVEEDITVAEAREDISLAATQRTTAILLDQYRGGLKREFDAIQSLLMEGNLADAKLRLGQLNDRSMLGSHLIEPWRVVLAGPPNVGKSSLLNLLLGYTRAIVHEQAGTTRDLLTEHTSFDGWPIELVDSAGIRTATDSIEATGIQQSLERIASADCTLLLVDPVSGWTKTHDEILAQCSERVILVTTKSDLAYPNEVDFCRFDGKDSELLNRRVKTSSVTEEGLVELMRVVVSVLVPQSLSPGDAVPFRQRHREKIATWMRELGMS